MSDWRPSAIILEEYMIEKELGRGGMGRVWLVKSQSTGRRFAVKQALVRDDKHRKAFFTELQTWIDLPEHPNIVPCRFFRTVGDEIVIFADFIDGGSLAEWIAMRPTSLEQVLDVAIQFAWGLHAIHERGLIHQDVKPGNVLMTPEGVPMVTDFGLARARMRAADGSFVSPSLSPEQQSVLVSSGGMTPAYASPEQRAGQPLSRKTDIWSWGVSVLDIFMGGVSCHHGGHIAAEVLEDFIANGQPEECLPEMPEDVADVLRNCFREDPAQRWQSLDAAVQKLRDAYLSTVGTEYNRPLGKITRMVAPQVGIGERRSREGGPWTDPCVWLEKALRAEGRDPDEAPEIVARHGKSRRGQLAADVATYDEARRTYERLIKDGRKDLESDLANLCHDAAFVHITSDDTSGALALYDQAIEIYERLVNVEGRRELANYLANLYQNKAVTVMNLGDNRAAVALHDRAIKIYDQLVNVEGRRELANNLAVLYMNKANVVGHLGDERAAGSLYDRAIETYERLVNIEGRRELASCLAELYQNKAIAVKNLGDNRTAVVLYDQAIKIYERLVNVEGRRELTNNLAILYMNKANVVGHLGDEGAAVSLDDRAIEIYERLVNIEGRRELANDLAIVYMNKAFSIMTLGDNRSAVALYDRAIKIYEQLVNEEGRCELANNLAKLYLNKANAVMTLGDNRGAVTLYDLAIKIRERLVNVEGRRELACYLAELYHNKAIAVINLGDNRAAVGLHDLAITIYERLVNVEDQGELAGDLARVKVYRGVVLDLLGETDRGKREVHEAIAVLRAEVNRTGRTDFKTALALALDYEAVG